MYDSSSSVTIILMALQCIHHIKTCTLLYAKIWWYIYMMILYSIKGSSAWRRLHYTNRTSLLLCIFHLITVLGLFDCTHVENTRSLIRTRCDRLWCSDLRVPRTFPMQDHSDFTRVFLKELLIMWGLFFLPSHVYAVYSWEQNICSGVTTSRLGGSFTIRGRLLN